MPQESLLERVNRLSNGAILLIYAPCLHDWEAWLEVHGQTLARPIIDLGTPRNKLPAACIHPAGRRLAEAVCVLCEKWSASAPEHSRRAWRERILASCQEGRTPWFKDVPAAEQLRRLGALLGALNAILVLRASANNAGENLERFAEWLARNSGLAVIIIAPHALASAFKRLDYAAASIEPNQHRTGPTERRSDIFPVHGRPHPHSPGERRLARALEGDSELAGLFHYNLGLTTIRGNRYVADLVWPAGRLVVEIDGFKTHTNRAAFQADRHRDYELTLSGYTILRITHDEVIADVDLAMAKIRDLVHYLQRSEPERSGR